MDDLTSKIAELIESQRSTNPDIKFLTSSHAPLVSQIISNYNLKVNKENRPSAEMIYLGAPTGAGKDTLVRKIMADNPDKNFIVLNMDMFRHYHNEIIGSTEYISDINFARQTNQTSFELYHIIQEIILREFPGTNIIVTGTIRDLEWVKDIVMRYRNNPNTNYNISLITLAVPTNESAFSIFERYLYMVNTRDSSNTPLRYTDLEYHNDTIGKFTSNVHYFEDDLHYNAGKSFFDSIKVYRRNKDILDLSEDTLVYDSENPSREKCAYASIIKIMNTPTTISPERISAVLNIIKSNSEYLKNQNLYKSIIIDLGLIVPQFNKAINDISK